MGPCHYGQSLYPRHLLSRASFKRTIPRCPFGIFALVCVLFLPMWALFVCASKVCELLAHLHVLSLINVIVKLKNSLLLRNGRSLSDCIRSYGFQGLFPYLDQQYWHLRKLSNDSLSFVLSFVRSFVRSFFRSFFLSCVVRVNAKSFIHLRKYWTWFIKAS